MSRGLALALVVGAVLIVYGLAVYGLDRLRRGVLGDERVMLVEVGALARVGTPWARAVDSVSERHGWPRWYVARVTAGLAAIGTKQSCFEERANPWKPIAAVVGGLATAVVSVIATPLAGLVTGTVTSAVAAGQPRTVVREVECP